MICPPVAYWNISLWSSSCSTIRHFMRKASHWRRSLKIYDWISIGVASISVVARHNRNGCPSPTFLWATSINASNVCIEIHPLDFSRPSLIVALVHSYKYLHSGQKQTVIFKISFFFLVFLWSKILFSWIAYPRQSWTCNPSPNASNGTGFDSSI